eukprot:364900-Chlamydomonas_euryale.AAC.6
MQRAVAWNTNWPGHSPLLPPPRNPHATSTAAKSAPTAATATLQAKDGSLEGELVKLLSAHALALSGGGGGSGGGGRSTAAAPLPGLLPPPPPADEAAAVAAVQALVVQVWLHVAQRRTGGEREGRREGGREEVALNPNAPIAPNPKT